MQEPVPVPIRMSPMESRMRLLDGTELAYVRYRPGAADRDSDESSVSSASSVSPTPIVRMLAVHGWQDSASSFARLAPYVLAPTTRTRPPPVDADVEPLDPRFVYDSTTTNALASSSSSSATASITDDPTIADAHLPSHVELVVVELAGHGRSSYLAPPAPYTQPLHCVHLIEFIERLGWRTQGVHLLSHSMGGGICSLLAASFPQVVLSLVMIESTGIWSHRSDYLVASIRTLGGAAVQRVRAESNADSSAQNYSNAASRAPAPSPSPAPSKLRLYLSIDAAGERYRRFNPDISSAGLRTLMERNLRPATGQNGFVFARDPRLNSSTFVFYTEDTIQHMMQQIACPVLFVVADSVTRRNARKAASKSFAKAAITEATTDPATHTTANRAKTAQSMKETAGASTVVVRANDSVERHVGSLDRAFRAFPARLQLVRHAHLCFIDGGHHIHLDQPEAVARAMHAFYSVERRRQTLRWVASESDRVRAKL